MCNCDGIPLKTILKYNMKKIIILSFVLFTSVNFAQDKGSYVNSGALSKNVNCGIGEIFIIPKIVLDKDKLEEIKKNENHNSQTVFENFIVFPNPVKDIMYIKTSKEVQTVSLYSIDGKLINTFDLQQQQQINLIYLNKGIYLLKSNESKFEPIKIIKE